MQKITKVEVLEKLPDTFTFKNGKRVSSMHEWEERKKEIYADAVELQYGKAVFEPEFLEVQPIHAPWDSKFPSYRIVTGKKEAPVSFILYVHLPKDYEHGKQYPAVIDGDLCFGCMHDADNIKKFTDNGIIFAKFNRNELADDNRFRTSRERGLTGQMYEKYPELDCGCISVWAWGYSRALDALEKLNLVDEKCVAFSGLSRGAKTALLAGVLDKRATIVNPVATCAGGAGCYRLHMEAVRDDGSEGRSETLKDIWNSYPWWFSEKFGKYAEDETKLPFDSHELLSLIAPRTLLLSNAADDTWANPLGAYHTVLAAREAWKLYGCPENVYWYWLDGGHSHKPGDFEILLSVMQNQLNGGKIDERMYRVPFETGEKIFDWECPEIKR